MKSILALDISKSALGWAFGTPGDVPISGVHQVGKVDATDDEVWRNGMVWLNQHMSLLNPGEVAMEAAILTSGGGFTNPKSQALLLGLQAVMRTVIKARMPGRAVLVASSTARKVLTGRGTFPAGEAKDAVQQECLRRGWLDGESLQADRADALAVWCARAAVQLPELAFHQPKRAKP
jgi:hypothetical protein